MKTLNILFAKGSKRFYKRFTDDFTLFCTRVLETFQKTIPTG